MFDTRLTSIGIVSGADEIRLRSYVNHTIYARMHGLDYRLECGLARGITNKFFYKSRSVERLLPNYDWLVWLDDDAFITDLDRDGFRALASAADRAGEFLVIAEGAVEPRGFSSLINTGAFLIRNEPRSYELLRLMHRTDLRKVREWWDEAKFGIFTNGDQDLMTWVIATTDLGSGVRIVGHRDLNSRTHFYRESLTDAFVCHFCGHYDKKLSVARFAQQFGIGQELVRVELLDTYGVRVRDPMSPAETWVRGARQTLAAKAKPYLRGTVRRFQARRERRMGFQPDME